MSVAFSTKFALLSFSLDYGDLDICGKVIGGLALPLFRESSGILQHFIEYHT